MSKNEPQDVYDKLAFAVVSPKEAAQVPYPYVYVTESGSAHELDAEDHAYLEQKFHPGDGARPYVKSRYKDKDGWGSISGLCPRRALPKGITINPEPVPREPAKPLLDQLRELSEEAGSSWVANADGTFSSVPKVVSSPWWKFWKK